MPGAWEEFRRVHARLETGPTFICWRGGRRSSPRRHSNSFARIRVTGVYVVMLQREALQITSMKRSPFLRSQPHRSRETPARPRNLAFRPWTCSSFVGLVFSARWLALVSSGRDAAPKRASCCWRIRGNMKRTRRRSGRPGPEIAARNPCALHASSARGSCSGGQREVSRQRWERLWGHRLSRCRGLAKGWHWGVACDCGSSRMPAGSQCPRWG